ncbi:C40 family peptidase [Paractinoplanes maris]|uniref:C40 family peptidase n=1 Tax=Paractinoplanes maris TaxID=1734446 RepID=UPI0020213D43|nr:C40 family peptidase [Actinoplanes maris]
MSFPLPLRRLLLLIAATAIATTLLITPSATRAEATPSAAQAAATPSAARAGATPKLTPVAAGIIRGNKIVAVARAQQGKPYKYGARGPGAFDCSGLSGFAYGKVGLTLPRTAQAQYTAARKISQAAARPGDLVFWMSGGRAYHVAVYAGAGRVWHAPKPGDRVKLARIWSASQVRFARIGS